MRKLLLTVLTVLLLAGAGTAANAEVETQESTSPTVSMLMDGGPPM